MENNTEELFSHILSNFLQSLSLSKRETSIVKASSLSSYKWYICGVGQHCKAGNQKPLITVMLSSAPSPCPSYTASSPSTSIPYTSAATGSAGTRYGWMMGVFGLLALLTANNCFLCHLISYFLLIIVINDSFMY